MFVWYPFKAPSKNFSNHQPEEASFYLSVMVRGPQVLKNKTLTLTTPISDIEARAGAGEVL